jgi:aspartyl-tRNA(Asn)/glutamyl-tRNA(Gln) amidotransferase subunit C
MSVSEQDVAHVADLANLELTAAEKTSMLRDLNAVLGYFAQLNELDTAAIPPMTQVSDAAGPHLREDQTAPSLARERVMAAAPDTDGVFFRVPKVIER